ncbi:hypothetical protein QV01_06485 [Gallibacterium genomosp. 3]|uniref:Acid shock protein n=1 Tax=Gallibacterium genomosp. 3 TaxID=505345 RepID=A0A1A7NQC3_9PAST|nr:hypothetical protein [Gallibacterium genomosp. 3]OBW91810.1 hypothetical protein QV01_06485 [Gallibacterium genomosp. 3]
MLVNKKVIVNSLLVSVFAMASISMAQAAGETMPPMKTEPKMEQVMPKPEKNILVQKTATTAGKHTHMAKQGKNIKHHALAKKESKKVGHKQPIHKTAKEKIPA